MDVTAPESCAGLRSAFAATVPTSELGRANGISGFFRGLDRKMAAIFSLMVAITLLFHRLGRFIDVYLDSVSLFYWLEVISTLQLIRKRCHALLATALQDASALLSPIKFRTQVSGVPLITNL
jgi:hypothetical protein